MAGYYKALVEADIYVGGDSLQSPETGTTVRVKDGKRHVQDAPFADTLRGFQPIIIFFGQAQGVAQVGMPQRKSRSYQTTAQSLTHPLSARADVFHIHDTGKRWRKS
ncbi:MAG: hypothetical protein WBM04_12620 [Candidatus Korobacteraceae bacterium]